MLLMGKSTISLAMFNSYVNVYKRVNHGIWEYHIHVQTNHDGWNLVNHPQNVARAQGLWMKGFMGTTVAQPTDDRPSAILNETWD